jgi:hypothetical protein
VLVTDARRAEPTPQAAAPTNGAAAPRSSPSSSGDGFGEIVVSQHIPCRRCGYDLIGLSHRSICPECGLDVWETLTQAVDPAASRLPRLRKPVRVGNALFLLATCLLTAVLLQALPALGSLVRGLEWSSLAGAEAPQWVALMGVVPAMLGLVAVFLIAHPPPEEPAKRVHLHLRMLSLGLLGWASLSSLAPLTAMFEADATMQTLARLAAAPFALVGLIGLRELLKAIGQRSRTYRRSRGGRQSVDAMIAAQIARIIGFGLTLLAQVGTAPALADFGEVLIWSSGFLMIVGLLYLVGNAWVIRSSLVKPPPGLNEIVGHVPPAGSGV